MVKLNISTSPNVPPLSVQQYERYLPTAFDESLSILQKINKMIQQLNSLGQITNDVVKQWNEVVKWLMNEGLENAVETQIQEMIDNGTFNQLITALVGDLTLLDTTDKTNLVIAINEVYELTKKNKNEIGDLTLLDTTAKDNIVNAINEIYRFTLINNEVTQSLLESTGRGVISGFKVQQQPVLAMAVQIGDSSQPNIIHMSDGKRFELPVSNIPIDNASTNSNRIDVVYVDLNGQVKVQKGTNSTGQPTVPTIPDNVEPLAHVYVPMGDTTVNNADITDVRTLKGLRFLTTLESSRKSLVMAINSLVESDSEIKNTIATNYNSLVTMMDDAIMNVVDTIGELNNLTIVEKTNVVSAINYVFDEMTTITNGIEDVIRVLELSLGTDITGVQNDIGDISTLETVDKTNVVNAINEVNRLTNESIDKIGNLASLPTTIKTDLVSSITEIYNSLDGIINGALGDITNLKTTDKTNAVNAINEVYDLASGKMEQGSLFVNVKDFGAVGDGIADDSDAINSAFQSLLPEVGGRHGGKVFFPRGIYLISKPIQLFGNVMVEGVGRGGSTILLKQGANITAMLYRQATATSTATYWTQIRNICLDGQASLQSSANTTDGIRLEGVVECQIDNVGVRYCRGHGIHLLEAHGQFSIQPNITNCVIRAHLENHSVNSSGICLNAGSYDAQIIGNDIGQYKNGNGIFVRQHNGAYITNNNVWQCKYGYHVQQSNRIRLTGNLSDYAQEFGFYIMQSSEIQMVNCQSRWSSNKVNAFQVYDGIHVYSSNRVLIDGCTVFGGNGTDIVAEGKGQTAFAVAVSGTSSDIVIDNIFASNVKGYYYADTTVTNIKYGLHTNNLEKNITFISPSVATADITFKTPRLNLNYGVNVTPTWNCYCWVSNVTVNGFTINFSTPPETGANVYWMITDY